MGRMSRKNRRPLVDRIADAAEAALAEDDVVAPIDVLGRIGWLQFSPMKAWQLGSIACLEEGLQADPARIADALALLRAWADRKGLVPSETPYVARTPQRQPLRFSRGGDAAIERAYRTHWLSPTLPARKREQIEKAASRHPELVVIMPLNHDWKCHRCGNGGDLLVMENPGPACLRCVGLGDLEYLPAGDALLSRR